MNRLKLLRHTKGVSQQAVADALQITQQAYANYESEKREPDQKNLVLLAEYFNTSTDYILGHTDDPTPPGEKRDVLDEVKFALWGHGEISDAALDDVRRFALFVEQREKEKALEQDEKNGKFK